MRPGRLLVVQPSADYAGRVRAGFPDAVFLATPERAVELHEHPAVVAADLANPAAALSAVRDWTRQVGQHPEGIVSFLCEHLPLTAGLARDLDLPFHSPEAVRRTRRKDLAAQAWQAAGVPTPPTRLVRGVAELMAFAREAPSPWILKPPDGTGSQWVLKAEKPEELLDAHRRITAGLADQADTDSGCAVCLAQSFVAGREFGADIYLEHGRLEVLRLTEKCLLREPGQAGLVGAYFVPRLEPPTRALLADAFLRGARALGLESGIAMGDVVLSGDTPQLLEMAVRPGGDCLPDLCRQVLGYDPIHTACRAALGGRPAVVPVADPEPVAAMHLMTRRGGAIRRIDFPRLLAHPRVVRLIEVYHLPGEELRCWEGSYDDRILAAVLVRYGDPAELPELSAALADLVDLELEDTAAQATEASAL